MIIKAVKSWDEWVLMTDRNIYIMEEKPIKFRTRKEAYKFCEQSWPLNSVWQGHKVKRGYYIKED